ncbi:hypothetical protein ACFVTY_20370 [Streptomyces sp. NPDC058067]|uniref:hypothetical protein n=1 Tax=Streptomyces sp. NPDC058067 TaxID=3346324 RepID=UPI0036EF4E71
MATQESFAVRSARAVRELTEAAAIETEIRPPDPLVDLPTGVDEVRAALSERVAEPVAARLSEFYFPAEEVHVSWDSTGPVVVKGEMCLSNLLTSLTRWHPPLEDPTLRPSERRVLAELKVVDEEPFAGTGRATGLRITDRGHDPEVWFYDMTRSRLDRLALDYGAYMECVLATKGAFGWQYLFADVDLGLPEFHDVAGNLSRLLDLFRDVFPDYSYEDLQRRLEARL